MSSLPIPGSLEQCADVLKLRIEQEYNKHVAVGSSWKVVTPFSRLAETHGVDAKQLRLCWQVIEAEAPQAELPSNARNRRLACLERHTTFMRTSRVPAVAQNSKTNSNTLLTMYGGGSSISTTATSAKAAGIAAASASSSASAIACSCAEFAFAPPSHPSTLASSPAVVAALQAVAAVAAPPPAANSANQSSIDWSRFELCIEDGALPDTELHFDAQLAAALAKHQSYMTLLSMDSWDTLRREWGINASIHGELASAWRPIATVLRVSTDANLGVQSEEAQKAKQVAALFLSFGGSLV